MSEKNASEVESLSIARRSGGMLVCDSMPGEAGKKKTRLTAG
jgi:hypothetical protein